MARCHSIFYPGDSIFYPPDIISLVYGIPHPDILSPDHSHHFEERASVKWMAFTEERYQDLVSYLRSVRYPPGFTANQKRGLRQQAAIFEEKDGVLFHSSVDSATGKKHLRRVIVATTEKNRLIHACHDGIDGGHYGRDKTLSKVRQLSKYVMHIGRS